MSFNKKSGSKYGVEVDLISKSAWEGILSLFKDARLEQTWSYGETRWGRKNLSHLIVKKDDNVVAATQLRIVKIPCIAAGIAYISNGPVWKKKEEEVKLENLKQIIRAVKIEYAEKRSLYVRIIPNIIDDEFSHEIIALFEEMGFKRKSDAKPHRTLLIDLAPQLEELKKKLHKKWRKNLRRAEKLNLRVLEGSNDKLFKIFLSIYDEMVARKRFVSFYDISKFRDIQKKLLKALKMSILICESEGEPINGILWSEIGDTAVTISSATANKGMKLYGAYLLRWQMLKRLKDRGISYLDQGGIDPSKNPGSYHFKSRFGGQEISNLGQFEICQNMFSFIIVNMGELLRDKFRKLKVMISKINFSKSSGSEKIFSIAL